MSLAALEQRDAAAAVRAGEPLELIERLAGTLADAGVRYCQWKGHFKRQRWSRGAGDIDLLLARDSSAAFETVLTELGFKLALSPAALQVPSVLSYIGCDAATGRLVHLHVHYRLVIGNAWRTTYQVPLERAALDSALTAATLFPIPSPQIELVLFVLRQVARGSLRDGVRAPRWLARAREELVYLEERAHPADVREVLERHLSAIDADFFQRALDSLRRPGASWRHAALQRELHRRMHAHARPAPSLARFTRSRKQLATGGAIIALAGADGAGKSTCARELVAWLSPQFATAHAHLGRPPRSVLTLIAGAALKVAQVFERWLPAPARYADQLRYIATARDRFHLYQKIQRAARQGTLVVCERYPVAEDEAFSGPAIPRSLPPGEASPRLVAFERGYYEQMLPPDFLIVLQVDPVTAVRRKTTEPADYVRERAHAAKAIDWSSTRAHRIDAVQPLADVLAEVKAWVWSQI